MDVPLEVRIVRINGLFHLLINGVYPLILTIDPNFQGHPSMRFHEILVVE